MRSEQPSFISYLRNHGVLAPLRGQGLKALALKGTAWTVVGFGSQKVLQLASNLILTRLLFPEAFGVMALVNVCMVGLAMFSDVGIKPAIIQNERGEDPAFLNTAWTIQIIRGFVLWAVACLIAYPAAVLYQQPQMFPLLCAVGATAAINGLQTTAMATVNRNMRFGRLTMLMFGGQAASIIVMVILAWIYQSVWALAIGTIFGAFVTTIAGFLVLPSHRHKLSIEKEAFGEIFKYGRWIFFATLTTFIGGQGILAIQGLLVPVDTLAFIYVASMFAVIVIEFMNRLVSSVVFPALSKIARDRPERLPIHLSRMRLLFLGVCIPSFIALSLIANVTIDVLYDNRYSLAGTYLAILAINGAFEVLPILYQDAFLATGDSRTPFILMCARLLFRIGGLFIGFHLDGVEGMLWGMGVGSFFYYFVAASFAHKAGWLTLNRDLIAIPTVLICAYLSIAFQQLDLF